ncbi:MAG: conjugal transfer protein TraX [Defluviitaleaceae bacterium]|nr:conjugal transfer protein TraX [Defluviitaleaceae bacterium]
MSAFVLKIIALIAMFIDHIGAVFPDYVPFEFRIIGRLTFPIFVYLIAEGFHHTRNPKKFLLRLLAFALIAEIPYDWAINRASNIRQGLSPWNVDFLNNTNIFYTLFLGGLSIYIFQHIFAIIAQRKEDDKESVYLTTSAIVAGPVLGIMWIADFLGAEYGGYGVIFILLMYIIKPKWPKLAVFAVMNVLQHRGLIQFIWEGQRFDNRFFLLIPATLLTVPLMAWYNGKRGPSLKWLFYAAYPVHLAILAVVAWVII